MQLIAQNVPKFWKYLKTSRLILLLMNLYNYYLHPFQPSDAQCEMWINLLMTVQPELKDSQICSPLTTLIRAVPNLLKYRAFIVESYKIKIYFISQVLFTFDQLDSHLVALCVFFILYYFFENKVNYRKTTRTNGNASRFQLFTFECQSDEQICFHLIGLWALAVVVTSQETAASISVLFGG